MKPKYKLKIIDTGQEYGFWSRKDLYSFLDLIDLDQFKEWYAEVIKNSVKGREY